MNGHPGVDELVASVHECWFCASSDGLACVRATEDEARCGKWRRNGGSRAGRQRYSEMTDRIAPRAPVTF